MSIITFYSYKGGVGRSMALANIAFELSKRGKRVLMVDWDLEAPGLERYFSNFKIENASEGLLSLLMEYENGNEPDYNKYLWTIHTNNDLPLYLLHSGRENDSVKYSANLEKFGWHDFFLKNKGGYHLENLRKQWLKDFDIVLIDSRTGLSDASGICTIMLPDIVVPMFTANYQSLFGIRDIVKYIQAARQKLSTPRMGLTILPVPSRFGTKVEFKESQEWLNRIADILKDCFSDWLPQWIEPRYLLEQVKIPQVDYFSFGEKLAVVEHGTSDPEGMGYIYAKLASLLASDFDDLQSFIGHEYYQKRKSEYEANNPAQVYSEPATTDFTYDVFISCHRNGYQWVKELLMPALTEYLTDELKYTPNIFFEFGEAHPDDSYNLNLQNAIQKSKTIIIVYSAAEVKNQNLTYGLSFFESRESLNKVNLIFPVIYKTDYDLDPFYPFNNRNITDLSAFNFDDTIKSTKLRALFGQEIEKLAINIAQSIHRTTNNPSTSDSEIDYAYQEIELLAAEYETLRKTLPSGNSRTILMENVVSKMKDKADKAEPFLDEFTSSSSPGKKLAAIATLHVKPNLKYLDWLAGHVGNGEKPFIGYQASVGLYIASRNFGTSYSNEILKNIDLAFENLNKYDYKDPNQISVLNAAKKALDMK
ncbi:tyrosine-protein kinase family protein [Mucilaginibacter sp. AW1-3]